jgi:complement component 1 Q subcomponent-binding protein, mitochondrial
MLSLRALARAAPRTTARLASSSTRTALRPAIQSTLRQQPRRSIPRCFSTSIPRFDDAATELAAKLNSEIQLESEGNSTPAVSDDQVAAFKEQNPYWDIVDNGGQQTVFLKRKYEGEEITVAFSTVDFTNNPYETEEADEAMPDEEDDFDTQSGGANTKGAVNQGRTSGGNVRVAPEDSVAPADRPELDDEQNQPSFPANVDVLIQRKNKVRQPIRSRSSKTFY